MRHRRLAAILAGGERFDFQSMVAAALVSAASSFMLLGNSHEFSPNSPVVRRPVRRSFNGGGFIGSVLGDK
jgi:hypothetical protein